MEINFQFQFLVSAPVQMVVVKIKTTFDANVDISMEIK